VLRNDDLSAKSPLFRVTGAGVVDLGAGTLDYKVKPVLVASLQGQGGAELDKLKGIPIPVQLTGPLTKPDWRIDIAEALTEAQKAKAQEKLKDEIEKRLPEELQEKLPGGLDKTLDGALKGLFN
jgi:AsmA protein